MGSVETWRSNMLGSIHEHLFPMSNGLILRWQIYSDSFISRRLYQWKHHCQYKITFLPIYPLNPAHLSFQKDVTGKRQWLGDLHVTTFRWSINMSSLLSYPVVGVLTLGLANAGLMSRVSSNRISYGEIMNHLADLNSFVQTINIFSFCLFDFESLPGTDPEWLWLSMVLLQTPSLMSVQNHGLCNHHKVRSIIITIVTTVASSNEELLTHRVLHIGSYTYWSVLLSMPKQIGPVNNCQLSIPS